MVSSLLVTAVMLAAAHAGTGIPDQRYKQFQLKTKVVAGSTTKNDLYLSPYHTGAGSADAVLVPQMPTDYSLYLNDTAILFNTGPDTNFFNTLVLGGAINYASWEFVTILSDSQTGPGGFYFNNSASKVDDLGKGLKWNPNYPYGPPPVNDTSEFGGWYACDWYHNVPQLFWVVRYEGSNNTRIATCSKVELIRVTV